MNKVLYIINYGRDISYLEYYATTDNVTKVNEIMLMLNDKGFMVRVVEVYDTQKELAIVKPNSKYVGGSIGFD